MRLSAVSGRWVPTPGGFACPHDLNLFVELALASMVGEDVRGLFGQDEGLWVGLRYVDDRPIRPKDHPLITVQVAVWVPVRGWMAVRGVEYDGLPTPGIGAALGRLATGKVPPGEVSSWLADILAEPAALILALQVMGS